MGKTTVVNIRDYKNWKAEGGVYIGRGFRGQKSSIFANPFRIGRDGDRDVVIEKYKSYLLGRLSWDAAMIAEMEKLRGKMLVCWCVPRPCHGEVIKEYLEGAN